jgi:nucleotide-binding universal stress UspA family protein
MYHFMEARKNIVLVPTDFTEVIDFAIEHAAGICRMQGYKLTLLHVINRESKSHLKKEKLTGSDLVERLDKTTAGITAKYGISSDSIVREGSIFTTIGEVAKEIGANMLVLGTHGKVGMQHITGSYALKVIESSPAPVIVVQKRGFREGFKNIILPMDDTSESKQKVKWAIHIARKFKSVVHIFAMKVNDGDRKVKVKANMEQIKKFFDQNDIKHTDKYALKAPGFPRQVMNYATEIDADMVLIMTNPDKMVPSFIVGKWVEQLLFNEQMIPIMAINPVELNIVVGGF